MQGLTPSLLIILIALAGCTPKPARPNVIIFLADDAGYADFGFHGNNLYRTPNLDQIGENGVRFTNAYASASVCGPSRAGLLTGRYQNRFGFEFNLYGMEAGNVRMEVRGLPVAEISIANLMKKAGYATGIVGKWGLGRHQVFQPSNRGFDEFFGILGDQSPYLPGKAAGVTASYNNIDHTKLRYLTDVFGDEAVKFIERHKQNPFFLFVSFTAPHAPLQAKPDYLDQFRKVFDAGKRAANAAMTRSMDDNVGKVLVKLKQLGLYENTIVIFTNDNGGALTSNGSSNAPLRGDKGSVFEGGIRVPMLMQWPSMLAKHKAIDFPVSTLDILPTILAAVGVSLPADRQYDGVDLMPYLTGSVEGNPHSTLFWRVNWAAAVRRGDWKLIRTPSQEYRLFNLNTDLNETTDVSVKNPEVVKFLKEQLVKWERALPEPLWQPNIMWKKEVLAKYDHRNLKGVP